MRKNIYISQCEIYLKKQINQKRHTVCTLSIKKAPLYFLKIVILPITAKNQAPPLATDWSSWSQLLKLYFFLEWPKGKLFVYKLSYCYFKYICTF